MKLRFLDFARCPDCRTARWTLSIRRETEDAGERDVEEGDLRCEDCGTAFPIHDGIPRLLPRAMREEAAPPGTAGGVRLTARGYDAQHLRDHARRQPGGGTSSAHEVNLENSRRYFREYLGLSEADLDSLRGRVVLDAGCGGGRFMWVAAGLGAGEIIGLDVSEGGLRNARGLLRGRRGVHFVQGDITHPPLREGSIDVIYSIGVLHHLPVPREGFDALTPLVAPGGFFWVWVYGLEGMSPAYRLSHLVWLRRITRNWSLAAKFRLAALLGHVFELAWLYPARAARKVLPPRIAARIPYGERTAITREDLTYEFFDRFQPPFTHYLKRRDLEAWLATLEDLRIASPGRRGWVAHARGPAISPGP